MADRYLIVDDVTGKKKRGASTSGSSGFVDQHFDVGGGGQTNFTVTQTFSAESKIDTYLNGALMREGATKNYQRNVSLNRIEFTASVSENGWVMIRVWL